MANFSESEDGSNLVVVSGSIILDDLEESADILAHETVVVRDDGGCDPGRASTAQVDLSDKLLNQVLADDLDLLGLHEEALELLNDLLTVDLGRTS